MATRASATSGATFGGSFESKSTGGTGLFAKASATSGNTFGASFESASPTGVGIFARSTATSGTPTAAWFETTTTGGQALYAWSKASTGPTLAGSFRNDSIAGIAVNGYASATTGGTCGGPLWAACPAGVGLQGTAYASTGSTIGILGYSYSPSGTPIKGFNASKANYGSLGYAGYGVYGSGVSSAAMGVRGDSRTTNSGVGVYGYTSNTTGGFGVYSLGRFGASGTKSFQIDHPLDPANKFLNHYCTESPEVLNAYRGTVTLDGAGEAFVDLPDYFARINKQPSYTLTAVGAPMPLLHIAREIDEATLAAGAKAEPGDSVPACSFRIAGGAPGGKVSWRIEAVRNDRWVQSFGAPVETEKQSYEKGKYQYPELYGQPKSTQLNPPAHEDAPTAAGANVPPSPTVNSQ